MRQQVQDIFVQTLDAMRRDGQISEIPLPGFSVEVPKNEAHGDYAVNAALVLAKLVGERPRELAQRILDHLVDPGGLIVEARVEGPGFINIRLGADVWRAELERIEARGARYGCAEAQDRGQINVEFVSANPTGPLHVGHGRGAVVGDVLARLLEAAGYQVTREYLVNDFGNQVDTLSRSIHLRYQELQGRAIEFPDDAYPAEYVRDIARAVVERDGDKWLDASEEAWLAPLREFGVAVNLESIRADLDTLDVRFDRWCLESELHRRGAVGEVVAELERRGASYVAERSQASTSKLRREDSKAAKHAAAQRGGTFARLSAYGDRDDRIVLRHDGTPVYLTADLAYHRDKLQRGYAVCIDVFGADHFSHTRTLRAGLEALGEESARLQFVLTQIVRLIRGGLEVRLSKRAGHIELLADLVKAVGPDATRFFFLMRAPSAQFDFDLDVATSHSLDNPVFYVQYGHARACAIFRRAAEAGVIYQGYSTATVRHLALPEELSLLRKMALFSQTIEDAAEAREPHRLVYFIQDLIRDFHAYYTRYKGTERILSDDVDKTQARLGLVNGVRQVIANGLNLLGVTAPEQMAPVAEEDALA